MCETLLTAFLYCESWPFSPAYFLLPTDQLLVILISYEVGYPLAVQFILSFCT